MVLFVAHSIYTDVSESVAKVTSCAPFLLLFVALLIALSFEFVNGFHDTANDRHYTRSPPANFAISSGRARSSLAGGLLRRCPSAKR